MNTAKALRDYRKEFRDAVLACVSGTGSAVFWVSVGKKKFRCTPNIEGGVNVYIGRAKKPTKALTVDEFVEWANEFGETGND